MLVRKAASIVVLAGILFACSFESVSAWAIPSSNEVEPIADSQISFETTNDTVSIEGVDVPLYKTFSSPESALAAISNNDAVQAIQDAYGYSTLSNENWKKYSGSVTELFDLQNCPEWYTEESESVHQLLRFFDVYENAEKNKSILAAVKTLPSTVQGNVGAEELLKLALPEHSYSALSEALRLSDSEANASIRAGSFNSNRANDYAWEYSIKRNPDYPNLAADCTNFASQVLENGGEPQVSGGTYNSVYQGWWHRTDLLGQHIQSHTWTVADDFMKYFGAKSPYGTNHVSFSFLLRQGDFISLDYDCDGDWDHVGYVITVGNGVISPQGYRDYLVAQHGSDYRANVSETRNGWETYHGEGRYGYFRR